MMLASGTELFGVLLLCMFGAAGLGALIAALELAAKPGGSLVGTLAAGLAFTCCLVVMGILLPLFVRPYEAPVLAYVFLLGMALLVTGGLFAKHLRRLRAGRRDRP